jgi:adenylate cyclase
VNSTSGKIAESFESIWSSLAPEPAGGHGLTVLFADVRGSQASVQLVNTYFLSAAEAVLDFGGTIDRSTSGRIIAAFFALSGRDSHERRAVKCALRLRNTIQKLSFPYLPLGVVRLGIGISTGITGIGTSADILDLAHSLQSLSAAGQIVISEATRRGMGNDLKCVALGSLQLKGRSQPVSAYAVC